MAKQYDYATRCERCGQPVSSLVPLRHGRWGCEMCDLEERGWFFAMKAPDQVTHCPKGHELGFRPVAMWVMCPTCRESCDEVREAGPQPGSHGQDGDGICK